MSKTANALLVKLLMNLVAAAIAFSVVGANVFGWVFFVGILGTVIDYLVGDLLILPKVGSLIGAVINGGLAALIALAVSIVFPAFTITTFSVLIFAVLIAIGEYFFHRYLLKADEVEP